MSTIPFPTPAIRLAKPDVGAEEIDAITRVLSSHILTGGPETKAFEDEFGGFHEVDHAVAFANGTLALVALLAALDIGPGDEVVVPSLTFVSTATSVSLVGASPVFADVAPDTFNLDPADVARRITGRTKAILAVHYGGQAADMAELQAVADDAGAILLEDAAEAHGARYRGSYVGGWSRAGMFSFTPTKNITTGEGGMITTRDGDLARRLRLLRNHGQTALYRHEFLGWNMRITEMQAAMGRCQVRKLPSILERKRILASRMDGYIDAISGAQKPLVRDDRDHVYMLYTVTVSRCRDKILDTMLRHGIEARVYFPPVHRQPIYSNMSIDLPVTDDLVSRIVSLPLHSQLTASEVDLVAATFGDAVGSIRG